VAICTVGRVFQHQLPTHISSCYLARFLFGYPQGLGSLLCSLRALAEIEDYVRRVFDDPFNRRKLMFHSLDLYGRDSRASIDESKARRRELPTVVPKRVQRAGLKNDRTFRKVSAVCRSDAASEILSKIILIHSHSVRFLIRMSDRRQRSSRAARRSRG